MKKKSREERITYLRPRLDDICHDATAVPWAFNGSAGVRAYRVTVELIDEPIDTIHSRIRALWRSTRPGHGLDAVMREAKTYGLVLDLLEAGVDFVYARKTP